MLTTCLHAYNALRRRAYNMLTTHFAAALTICLQCTAPPCLRYALYTLRRCACERLSIHCAAMLHLACSHPTRHPIDETRIAAGLCPKFIEIPIYVCMSVSVTFFLYTAPLCYIWLALIQRGIQSMRHASPLGSGRNFYVCMYMSVCCV